MGWGEESCKHYRTCTLPNISAVRCTKECHYYSSIHDTNNKKCNKAILKSSLLIQPTENYIVKEDL